MVYLKLLSYMHMNKRLQLILNSRNRNEKYKKNNMKHVVCEPLAYLIIIFVVYWILLLCVCVFCFLFDKLTKDIVSRLICIWNFVSLFSRRTGTNIAIIVDERQHFPIAWLNSWSCDVEIFWCWYLYWSIPLIVLCG